MRLRISLLLAVGVASDPCADLPTTFNAVFASGPSPQGLNGTWNFVNKQTPMKTTCPPFRGQLLVKVRAASVDPVDYKVAIKQKGGGLGMDVSGVVVAVGDGCAGFSVGDEVYGTEPPHVCRATAAPGAAAATGGPLPLLGFLPLRVCTGARLHLGAGSYAEFTWADCGLVGRRNASASPHMSLALYASLPIAAGTSLEALWDAGAPWAGRNATVVITSGAGGTGVFAIMQAVALGASRVVTAARPEHAPLLKQLGATEVVDYTAHSLWDVLDADSVDVVYDNYGAPGTADLAMPSLRGSASAGANSTFIFLPGKGGALSKHPKPGVRQVNYGLFTSAPSTYAALSAMVEAGTLHTVVQRRFALSAENIEAAFRLQAAGHVVGKLVIDVDAAV